MEWRVESAPETERKLDPSGLQGRPQSVPSEKGKKALPQSEAPGFLSREPAKTEGRQGQLPAHGRRRNLGI
jgi:hypothetical protein